MATSLSQSKRSSHTQEKNNNEPLCLISKDVMRGMGDYPTKKDWREHAISLIEEGIQCEEIRDELFCQIMKQLTNNTRV